MLRVNDNPSDPGIPQATVVAMHTAEAEAQPEVGASMMVGGRLDVLLAGLLGFLSLLLHWINGKWLGLPIDLVACAAAALFHRFSRGGRQQAP